ncbi:hypothetical protein AB0J01_37750 [Streptomyces sp. NPDC050204]|uniref:hypothetical protein n=1 Tax=Streptomyces sp. NPDC050204 TaxID=3155514 RepID=UPI003414F88E
MTPDLTTDEYDTARALLSNLDPEDTIAKHIPGPVAPGITPFVVPDGYTIRETVETTADGTKVTRDCIPLDPAPHPAAPTVPTTRVTLAPTEAPSTLPERRTLPTWLTMNRRKAKTAAYLAGAAGATTIGAVYGNDITAALTAGATALWHATLTVLKYGAIAVGAALFLRIVLGGRGRCSRTGTFEGSIKGTWRQD